MARMSQLVAGAGLAIVLVACARNSFETEGLIAPSAQCSIKPSELGIAEQLSAIDEGNGCEVPNPWRVHSVANVYFSQPATLNCGMAYPVR